MENFAHLKCSHMSRAQMFLVKCNDDVTLDKVIAMLYMHQFLVRKKKALGAHEAHTAKNWSFMKIQKK